MPEAPLMLGVSGLRGIVGKSLTPEVAARYAAAFGSWLLAQRRQPGDGMKPHAQGRPVVVIGADGRAGYESIMAGAAAGLRAAGCAVTDVGIAMTPTIATVVDHDAAEGGMVVTASHNPQEWNGLKCLVRTNPRAEAKPERSTTAADACAPPAALAAQIIDRFHGQTPVRVPDGDWRGGEDYIGHGDAEGIHLGPLMAVANSMPRGRRPRVVLDSVNGAGRFLGRAMLTQMFACELIHHGAEDTGLFPHPPEPTKENLGSLSAAVVKFNADVGFAQDPDADRLAIVDETGRYIGEEYTLVLAAVALLQARRDAAVTDLVPPGGIIAVNLSTSRMIDDVARIFHARVVRTPVGEANVVEAMKREAAAGQNVIVGGEGNGGVIWPRVTYVRDSLSAMALVLALMARTGRKLSELVADIPSYAIDKRKVDLARKEDAVPAVERLAAHYRSADTGIDLQDGVRVDWPARRAWLHVRASNTEPIMRLIAEAPTAAGAAATLDAAGRVIASMP